MLGVPEWIRTTDKPALGAIENFKGKKRVREFYAMAPEDAFELLRAIAEINGLEKNLKLIQPKEEDLKAEQLADAIETEAGIRRRSEAITKEEYFTNKNPEMVELYTIIEKRLCSELPDFEEYVIPDYIGLKKQGKYFVEFQLQQNKIRVMTLLPQKTYSIGNRVPENFLWTLKYRTYISNEQNVEELVELIKESYELR